MADRTSNSDVTRIDPMFYIPEGAIGFEYVDDESTLEIEDEDFDDEELEDDLDDSEEDDDDEPVWPDIISIQQLMRTNETGNQVVDVIVEVEDTESEYEFRVVKA